jgi:transposase-like protein
MKYSEAFKSKMVRKMAAPGGPSANALSKEVGVHQCTLSRWHRDAAKVGDMKVQQGVSSPKSWTASEKLEAVLEAASLAEDELGPFLRRKGLYRKVLEQWREQMLRGLEAEKARSRPSSKTPEGRRIRELEKELRRKDTALAETAALIVLKKKAQAIWGDGDGDTTPRYAK